MRPNPQFSADMVTFNEEIFNGKLHFSCSAIIKKSLEFILVSFLLNLKRYLHENFFGIPRTTLQNSKYCEKYLDLDFLIKYGLRSKG